MKFWWNQWLWMYPTPDSLCSQGPLEWGMLEKPLLPQHLQRLLWNWWRDLQQTEPAQHRTRIIPSPSQMSGNVPWMCLISTAKRRFLLMRIHLFSPAPLHKVWETLSCQGCSSSGKLWLPGKMPEQLPWKRLQRDSWGLERRSRSYSWRLQMELSLRCTERNY